MSKCLMFMWINFNGITSLLLSAQLSSFQTVPNNLFTQTEILNDNVLEITEVGAMLIQFSSPVIAQFFPFETSASSKERVGERDSEIEIAFARTNDIDFDFRVQSLNAIHLCSKRRSLCQIHSKSNKIRLWKQNGNKTKRTNERTNGRTKERQNKAKAGAEKHTPSIKHKRKRNRISIYL